MKLLAIDTSTDKASIALATSTDIITEEQEGFKQHAQLLLPMIDRLLRVAGFSINQLDGIVFGRGPGSFTGLRVACSVAKGLAYAQDLPVYPVSSLAAIAYEASRKKVKQATLAMLDARMQQVYWAYFSDDDFSAPSEHVTSPANIALPSQNTCIVAGVGFESYVLQFPPALQSVIAQQYPLFPTAKAMLELVQLGQIRAVSAMDALPVYVRNQVTQGEKARG